MANTQIKITVSEETLKRLTYDGVGKPSIGLALWARRIAEMDTMPVPTPDIVVRDAGGRTPARVSKHTTVIPSAAPAAPAAPVQLNAAEWE